MTRCILSRAAALARRAIGADFASFASSALLLALAVTPAAAQTLTCLPHAAMAEMLASRYGEVRQSVALLPGGLAETWANPETRTWTWTITSPAGSACIVAAGDSWERLHEPLPAPMGEPA